MTFDEWKVKASEFPTIGDAERWRQANGVEVEGLPAPTRNTGMAATPQPTGALPGAAPQGEMDVVRQQLIGYPERQAMERKAQFEAGQKRLAEMYGGPSTSQTLFALSQALLSPRPYGGFAGTLYNVSQALGGIQQQRTEADRAREEAQYKLQQQYAQAGSEDELKSLELRYKLLKEQQDTAEAAAKVRTGFNPITGELVNMDTGILIENTELPVLTPEQVGEMSRDPKYKGYKFRTTDGREMEIK
jgi:hypothetical protein